MQLKYYLISYSTSPWAKPDVLETLKTSAIPVPSSFYFFHFLLLHFGLLEILSIFFFKSQAMSGLICGSKFSFGIVETVGFPWYC